MSILCQQNGYSLIELVVVIVIIGILTAVAVNTLDGVEDISRFEETRAEMELLAFAIAGNPELVSGGVRIDYGYLGDIGALPPNWDALVSNPGYSTWNGPYITDEFSTGVSNTYFKLDAWGMTYSSPNNIQFASTGSAQTITRQLANSNGDILYNRTYLTLTDYDLTPPGSDNVDSAKMLLTFPDGVGGLVTKSKNPTANGLVVFDSVPIGIHQLRTIIIPNNDTLIRMVNINPGQDYYADIQYYDDIWGGGGSGGTDTLRPDGAGSLTNLTNSGCSSNYQCVDEVSSDDDATIVI
ncbi:MAG: prepilin-type N-terminal cleavage/methylation domain-containing protein, partial [Candidatus Zixiibacteriota bacterium]